MSIIIDLNQACLVCLQENKELHSIFDLDEQTSTTIVEKIALCSDLQTPCTENSKLPDKICARCINDLNVVWTFQQNCKAANTIFRSILQEDDAEVIAGLEPEQEKIRLPTGLQIKRVAQENISLMPVDFVENADIAGDLEQHEQEILHDSTDEQQISLLIEETDDVNEEDNFEEEILEEEYYDGENEYEEESCSMDGDVAEDNTGDVRTNLKTEITPLKIESHIQSRSRDRHKAADSYTDEEFLSESEIYNSSAKKDDKSKCVYDEEEYLPIKQTKTINHKRSTDRAVNNSSKTNKSKPLVPRKPKRFTGATRPLKICEICGNTYKYQHALNAHMRRHTNTRPFPCEFCDKAFISNVELRRHLRVHTGQKPYACQYCDRRFSDFGSRIKHERSHTGERPYVCYCGKSFAYAHVLTVHLRTHTGEKKFQCTQCSKGFTKKAYLQAHMEQHSRVNSANSTTTATAKSQRDASGNRTIKETLKSDIIEECIFDDDDDYAIDDIKMYKTETEATTHKQSKAKDDEYVVGV